MLALYALLFLVYVFIGAIVYRVTDEHTTYISPLPVFAGYFWPVAVPIIGAVILAEKPADWVLSIISKLR